MPLKVIPEEMDRKTESKTVAMKGPGLRNAIGSSKIRWKRANNKMQVLLPQRDRRKKGRRQSYLAVDSFDPIFKVGSEYLPEEFNTSWFEGDFINAAIEEEYRANLYLTQYNRKLRIFMMVVGLIMLISLSIVFTEFRNLKIEMQNQFLSQALTVLSSLISDPSWTTELLREIQGKEDSAISQALFYTEEIYLGISFLLWLAVSVYREVYRLPPLSSLWLLGIPTLSLFYMEIYLKIYKHVEVQSFLEIVRNTVLNVSERPNFFEIEAELTELLHQLIYTSVHDSGFLYLAIYILLLSLIPIPISRQLFYANLLTICLYVILIGLSVALNLNVESRFLFEIFCIQLLTYLKHKENMERRWLWVQFKLAGVKQPFQKGKAIGHDGTVSQRAGAKQGKRAEGGDQHTWRQKFLSFFSAVVKSIDDLLADPPIRISVEKTLKVVEASQRIAYLKRHDLVRNLLIDLSDIYIQNIIGRGAAGEIYKVIYTDSFVALKCINVTALNQGMEKEFMAELYMLNTLRHPNIVQLMGVVLAEKNNLFGFLMELMDRGSLRAILRTNREYQKKAKAVESDRNRFSWLDPKCKFALDICRGMIYLHEKRIVHRDFKTENILVSSTLTCKISDFATSKKLEEDDHCSTLIGTPFWRAPEMIRKERYTEKVDVFSFALILLEIELQQDPFHDMNKLQQLEYPVLVSKQGFHLSVPEATPAEIKALIHDCGQLKFHARPSFLTVRRRLQRLLDKLQGLTADTEIKSKELGKLMFDQIIMSEAYVNHNYRKGDVIIDYGEEGNECYIILKGTVDINIPDSEVAGSTEQAHEKEEDILSVKKKQQKSHVAVDIVHQILRGVERDVSEVARPVFEIAEQSARKFKKVASYGQYEYFGEMALMAHTKRSGRCVAASDVVCLSFTASAFSRVFDEDIKGLLASRIMATLGGKASNNEQRQMIYSTAETYARKSYRTKAFPQQVTSLQTLH